MQQTATLTTSYTDKIVTSKFCFFTFLKVTIDLIFVTAIGTILYVIAFV